MVSPARFLLEKARLFAMYKHKQVSNQIKTGQLDKGKNNLTLNNLIKSLS